MKVKTAELLDEKLDFAVVKCEVPEWSDEDAIRIVTTFDEYDGTICNYSTDWAQAGPIIEREGISLVQQGDAHEWVASIWYYAEQDWHLHTPGHTALIAAMRCYVASKMGDEVEIPEELT